MGWIIRRVLLVAAIVVASMFVTLATTVRVPDRAVASSPAQVPPSGPVDDDDDPNEVDDGLPDSVLDPEDLIALAAPAARPPVPVLPSPAAAVSQSPAQTQQTVISQTSPQTITAGPVTPASAAPASAAPPAPAPRIVTTESCEIVRTQQTVQRTPVQAVIEVRATGSQEVPPVSTPGSAIGRFTFHEASSTLEYFVTNFGFSPNLVTAAHLHRGAAGVNGPIVHFISATGFMQATGRLQLSAADVADLKAGNLYLNLHSQENPAGYARGQLVFPAPESHVEIVEQQVCRTTQIQAPSAAAPARPVVVAPASARGVSTVAPPSAGDGGLLLGSSASGFLLFILVVVTTSATVLGTMTRRS